MATNPPKVVLITGTSTGIGFQLALTFAGDPDRKYKVYATMRNMEKKKAELEEAARELLNTTLLLKELDVGDDASRVKCVEEILAEEKRIDVLINNAMLCHMVLPGAPDWEERGREHFGINFFGPIRLMQLVIPGMKERRTGRILNISSIAAIFPSSSFGFYAETKRALEASSEDEAVNLRPFNVWVSVLQLGAVMTQRTRQLLGAYAQCKDYILYPAYIEDEHEKQLYAKQMQFVVDTFHDESCQSAEEVSQFIKETAEVDKPSLYYQTSEFTREIAAKIFVDTTGERKIKLREGTALSLAK